MFSYMRRLTGTKRLNGKRAKPTAEGNFTRGTEYNDAWRRQHRAGHDFSTPTHPDGVAISSSGKSPTTWKRYSLIHGNNYGFMVILLIVIGDVGVGHLTIDLWSLQKKEKYNYLAIGISAVYYNTVLDNLKSLSVTSSCWYRCTDQRGGPFSCASSLLSIKHFLLTDRHVLSAHDGRYEKGKKWEQTALVSSANRSHTRPTMCWLGLMNFQWPKEKVEQMSKDNEYHPICLSNLLVRNVTK